MFKRMLNAAARLSGEYQALKHNLSLEERLSEEWKLSYNAERTRADRLDEALSEIATMPTVLKAPSGSLLKAARIARDARA